GDRYVYAGLGTTVLLGPKVTVRAEAGQPEKQAMDAEDLRSYRQAMTRGPLRAFLGGGAPLARLSPIPPGGTLGGLLRYHMSTPSPTGAHRGREPEERPHLKLHGKPRTSLAVRALDQCRTTTPTMEARRVRVVPSPLVGEGQGGGCRTFRHLTQ